MALISKDDEISYAMLDGLLLSFKRELRSEFKKVSDRLIRDTVETISKRLKIHLEQDIDDFRGARNIHLTWLLKEEKEDNANDV